MHCWTCNAAINGWIDDDDCNNNGIKDVCDVISSNSEDCDGDGIPDECQKGACCGYNGGGCAGNLTGCECNSGSGTFLGAGTTCASASDHGACCGYNGSRCGSSKTQCDCFTHSGTEWHLNGGCGAYCHTDPDPNGAEGGGGEDDP